MESEQITSVTETAPVVNSADSKESTETAPVVDSADSKESTETAPVVDPSHVKESTPKKERKESPASKRRVNKLEEKYNQEVPPPNAPECELTAIGTAEKLSDYMKSYSKSEEGKNLTKPELIRHLIKLVAPAALRTRFEVINSDEIKNNIDQDEKAHEEDDIESTFSILDNPDIKIGRVMLSKRRYLSNFGYELTFSANGLILDSDTWNVIVSPVKAFNPVINKKSIITNFSDYKLYKMRDGTTVNLYYYGGSWCISTLNGYDVGEYRWMGSKTYMEALADAFYNLSRGAVGYEVPNMEVVFNKLNKTNCYSLGFRHPDFHPFTADGAGVWMIRSYNLETREEESMDDLGFPQQIEITAESIVPRKTYPGKNDEDYHRRVFDEIVNMNFGALNTFRKSNSNARKNKNTIADSFGINYGFILRAPFDKCGYQSNIALESHLYGEIRRFIYNQPYIASAEKEGVTFENRLEYSVLRAYLDFTHKQSFITLFPQFDANFKICRTLVDDVVDKVMKLARFGNTGNTNYSAKNRKKKEVITEKFAEKLFNHIKTTDPTFGTGGRFGKDNKKIVTDYVCNPSYTDVYFMILNTRD